jgi:PBP1b-binding outer membrane lipoprotein LpoB
MKKGRMMVLALSALFLGGCATQVGEISPNPALMAGTDPVPKESVAAARCPESYQIQNARQGAFHREIVC